MGIIYFDEIILPLKKVDTISLTVSNDDIKFNFPSRDIQFSADFIVNPENLASILGYECIECIECDNEFCQMFHMNWCKNPKYAFYKKMKDKWKI